MRKKAAVKILLFVLFLAAAIYLLRSQLSLILKNGNISSSQRDTLLKQAAASLEAFDVPIGAIILYDDTILSSGYNTFQRDTDAGGHAEINAINQAIRKIGFTSFSALNRDRLILVSTFEPCMMCRGAIIEYNIRHAYFMKGKGLFHWLKNDAKEIIYEWNKKKCDGDEMQDSLFMRHPKFERK